MELQKLLNQLNLNRNEVTIESEPMSSQKKLLKFEEKYSVNTKTIIKDTIQTNIPNPILTDWFNTYQIFKDYNGLDENINQQSKKNKKLLTNTNTYSIMNLVNEWFVSILEIDYSY